MNPDEYKLLLLLLLYRRLKRRRKNRRMWIHPIVSERGVKSCYHTLWPQVRKDDEKFFNFTRMSQSSFDELFTIIKEELVRENTVMRDSIHPEERLVIAIRYLASGCSFADLHYAFRVGKSTASQIVKEVCQAIWKCVAPSAISKFTQEKWLEIAASFQEFANFPHCIGAIDGKHIRIIQPSDSGSLFYNYKGFFSIVLLAICDANYQFTYIDIGAYGKCSDSGIFKNSSLYDKLQTGLLNIPVATPMDGSTVTYPYVIVGDEAFALSENVLRPYGGKYLTDKKKIFNYRLYRARRYIECSFGILVNKWRIFHRALNVDVNLAEDIVKATCVLHNFVRQRDGVRDVTNNATCQFPDIDNDNVSRSNRKGHTARDKFADYFVDIAPLPWQDEVINDSTS